MFHIRKVMAVAAVAALGLAGCSSDSGSSSSSSSTGGDSTAATLTVWTSQEDQANADSWLQTMQAKFAEANPNYEITWKNLGNTIKRTTDTLI